MIMSKYNFAKRLKRMLDKECEITRMETKLARKSAKYYEAITELKTTLARQNLELEAFRREVDKLKRHNDRLEEFTQEEEQRLAATVKKIQELQKECDDAVQRQIEQRKVSLMHMDLIRKIKQTTQTYFNLDALPHKFQGVKLCEKETSTEWKPFVNDVKEWIRFLEEQLQHQIQDESSTDVKNMTINLS